MRTQVVPALLMLVSSAFAADTATAPAGDAVARVRAQIDALYPQVEALYIDLHQNPELSLHEEKTSAKLAERMRKLGYEVTTNVGGYGIVAIMKNGAGPTLMIRTDMDALPVHEETGLPYASKVTAKDDSGAEVSVMHACGHDVHMATWIGTATILAKSKDLWNGTLMFIGQPAEERIVGAKMMLDAGLFQKFSKPDVALAIHDHDKTPSGTVGVVPEYIMANADAIDLTIYGRGGHGAYPHTTVDPIVIAARTIVALQTVVARENDPLEPAVITVGSIHGGTKHNIIPNEVKLQLTVRSYKSEVREKLIAAIERISKAEAAAALAPREPVMKVVESTKATYNDPTLTARVGAVLKAALGADNVLQPRPEMGAEDFSEFVGAGVPGVYLWVGAVEPTKYSASQAGGPPLPSTHSSLFAPDRERTLRTAMLAETLAALELIKKSNQ
jgi:hippurate hydrolase